MGCGGSSEKKNRLIDEIIEIQRRSYEQSLGMMNQAAATNPQMQMMSNQMQKAAFDEAMIRKAYRRQSIPQLEQLKSMTEMSGNMLEGLRGGMEAAQGQNFRR